jgi:hypothetical protein
MALLKLMGLLVLFVSPLFLDQIERAYQRHFDYVSCPQGERFDLVGPFPANGGHSFVSEVAALEAMSDDSANPLQSPIRLCEGKRQLGTGHIPHADIVNSGKGRFSHWGRYIIFTASDNSNPNTNGRKYTAVKMDYASTLAQHPPHEPPTLMALIKSAFKVSGK